MKQTLTFQQRQQLRLSQQLQQNIRLMQLSSVELSQEIQTACESNVMLDWADGSSVDEEASYDEPLAEDYSDDPHQDSEELLDEDEASSDQGELNELHEALDHDPGIDLDAVDSSIEQEWSDTYLTDLATSTGNLDRMVLQTYRTSLTEHLFDQLEQLDLPSNELSWALRIIESLNPDGYLTDSLLEIALDSNTDETIDEELLQSVLTKIQELHPPGIGARNLRECLLIQLLDTHAADPVQRLAFQVVDECFDELTSRDFSVLERMTGSSRESLDEAISFIQTLNPRPGAEFCDVEDNYIIPDVFVRHIDGEWVVDINDDAIPSVRINSIYAQAVSEATSKEQRSFLRAQLRDAKVLLDGLKHRSTTLLKAVTAIVEEQRAFFEKGESFMRPLLRSDIALMLGVHESTVSRITMRKYMSCPRGIFELSYFFSSHVHTMQGNEISSRAIKALIRQFTDEEDPAKPLSDSSIVSLLRDKDIRIARRTVAKYRESLSIPPSKARQISI